MSEELKKDLEYLFNVLDFYNCESVESKIFYCEGFLEKKYPEITKLLDKIRE